MKIGQVANLLKMEFPTLSISKARYLEGEGLISPHRVGSGYCRYSQADLERLCYALTVQRDEYLPLHVIHECLTWLDADVEVPALQLVARVVIQDSRIVNGGPMGLEVPLAHSGASESQIKEPVAVGLISSDVRGRYSQQNFRTVHLAMGIIRRGVPLHNLRVVRAPAERETDMINQAVTPRRSRSRSAGEETVWELAEPIVDLHMALLRRVVDALG